eukprot:scaffold102815_cov22-Tisochrysis_lutea.AAC.1
MPECCAPLLKAVIAQPSNCLLLVAHNFTRSLLQAHVMVRCSTHACNHVWQVPPKDSRYSDPSAMLEKSKGLSGTHVAKGQHLPNQG